MKNYQNPGGLSYDFYTDYPVSQVMPGRTGGVIRYYLANVFLTDQEKCSLLYENARKLLFGA